MSKLTKTRIALNASKIDISRTRILEAAVRVAEVPGGWNKLTRDAVAKECHCSDALISRYFGTMLNFKRTIMRFAIQNSNLSIIAQGLAVGDCHARKASHELKQQALNALMD